MCDKSVTQCIETARVVFCDTFCHCESLFAGRCFSMIFFTLEISFTNLEFSLIQIHITRNMSINAENFFASLNINLEN